MKLHISPGNIKTGAIPSFSLPSGKTCSREACATCHVQGCYAAKLERLRPNVRNAYADNLRLVQEDLDGARCELNAFFYRPVAPRFFRIHVSGDFFSAAYLEMWLDVVRSHPNTKFLAFTKQFEIVSPYLDNLPENFSLVASGWPGVPIPQQILDTLPVAWMQDGTENRIPPDAVECSGGCDACGFCWATRRQHVFFHKH